MNICVCIYLYLTVSKAADSGVALDIVASHPEHMHATELQDIMISVDKRRMTQAIQLLLGNALRFSPRGGAVSVTVQAVDKEHSQRQRNGLTCIRIDITDRGQGIPTVSIHHICTSYHRLIGVLFHLNYS